ncbi:hypothetical protein OH77DRAFT_1548247 [Trametes cingulata]|nr:hypothetical protein OH77DRAFT_1548247 [Trametes cingulata]
MQGQSRRDYLLYRELRGSFSEALENHGLLFRQLMPCTVTLNALISDIVDRMQNSPQAYIFPDISGSHIIAAEAVPLQPLELINNGKPRASTNAVHLRVAAIPLSMTLAQMIQPGGSFYKRFVNDCTIEDDHLVIHLGDGISPPTSGCRLEPLIFHETLPDGRRRAHRCISHRIYGHFPSDSFAGAGASEVVTSDGEDVEDDGATVPPTSPTPSPAGDTAPNSPIRSAIGLARTPHSGAPILRPSGSTLLALHFLPGTIWDRPNSFPASFQPTPPDGHHFQLDDLPRIVYERAHGLTGAATDPTPPKLVVSGGPDVAGLADAFRDKVLKCCDEGDFTDVLSPSRTFRITQTTGNPSPDGTPSQGHTLSVGSGVEREVLHLAFQHYRDAGARWFLPRADGFATISVSQSTTTGRHISPLRLRELRCLGALAALMLANRMAPTPLDPLFLHYLVFNCNLHSLTPALCAEWHPDLRALIQSWLDMGPQGDVTPFQSHFSSYHDRQIACMSDRDERSHKAIAAEMLHVSVIGPEPPEHPELQAFLAGFRLPCRNGFRFCEIPRAFSRGPAAFWSMIWHTHMSSFAALEDHLDIVAPSSAMCLALANELGEPGASPTDFLIKFLKGEGIPDADALQNARGCFTPSVLSQLEHAAEPGFRVRMFTLAVTGSTSLAPNDTIRVEFVTGANIEYGPDGSAADSMIEQGKFSIRTCYRQLLIPFTYLRKLVRRTLASGDRDRVRVNVDNWFLLEILNAIGGHSML